MYEPPPALPEALPRGRSRWAPLRYLLFWLLAILLVTLDDFEPAPLDVPDVVLNLIEVGFFALPTLTTLALYWVLGHRFARQRLWLLGLLGGGVALGYLFVLNEYLGRRGMALGLWLMLLLGVIGRQLIAAALCLLRGED